MRTERHHGRPGSGGVGCRWRCFCALGSRRALWQPVWAGRHRRAPVPVVVPVAKAIAVAAVATAAQRPFNCAACATATVTRASLRTTWASSRGAIGNATMAPCECHVAASKAGQQKYQHVWSCGVKSHDLTDGLTLLNQPIFNTLALLFQLQISPQVSAVAVAAARPLPLAIQLSALKLHISLATQTFLRMPTCARSARKIGTIRALERVTLTAYR